MNKKKLSKKFLEHPETKAFAKKFADDIATILIQQFEQSGRQGISQIDIENELQKAMEPKQNELKEYLEKMASKLQKDNEKVLQKSNLVKINIR